MPRLMGIAPIVLLLAAVAPACSRWHAASPGAVVAIYSDEGDATTHALVVDVASGATSEAGPLLNQVAIGRAGAGLVFAGGDPTRIVTSLLARAAGGWTLAAVSARPVEAVSPDGTRVAYGCGPGEPFDPSRLCTEALPGAATAPTGPFDTGMDHPEVLRWTSAGIVIASGGSPHRVARLDPASGAIAELGVLPTRDRPALDPDGVRVAWIERDGKRPRVAVGALGADPSAATRYDLGAAAGEFGNLCSFAGARVVCTVAARPTTLVSIDLSTGAATTLATEVLDIGPVVSPDGASVAYAVEQPDHGARLMVTAVGAAAPRALAIGGHARPIPVAWLP